VKLLTVKEVAGMLNVAEKTLYQWCELRQIPHVKMNGCLRFDPRDIEKWLVACKKQPATEYNRIETQARSPRRR